MRKWEGAMTAPLQEQRRDMLPALQSPQCGSGEEPSSRLPQAWSPGPRYGTDRMRALTWDSPIDGQETPSTQSMSGLAPQKPPPLGGQTVFSGLLLAEAATMASTLACLDVRRWRETHFSKGSCCLPLSQCLR